MRYFIDTEFNAPGAGKSIDLISIGIVTEDGREFYACNHDFNPNQANQWVRDNVLPLLPKCEPGCERWGSSQGAPRGKDVLAWMPYDQIGHEIRAFIGDDPDPEFWGYYCAFDYVLLSQLMGGMDEWPDGWPYYMRDLRQWLDERGHRDLTQSENSAHDALADARWIAWAFEFVSGMGEEAA